MRTQAQQTLEYCWVRLTSTWGFFTSSQTEQHKLNQVVGAGPGGHIFGHQGTFAQCTQPSGKVPLVQCTQPVGRYVPLAHCTQTVSRCLLYSAHSQLAGTCPLHIKRAQKISIDFRGGPSRLISISCSTFHIIKWAPVLWELRHMVWA